jgi:biotin carboxyl carrier protein
VQVTPIDEQFHVFVGDRRFEIAAQAGELGRLDLCVDGRRQRAYVARQGDHTYVWIDGDVYTLVKPDMRQRRTQAPGQGGALEAAMPGRVLDVLVKEGDAVRRGDTLVLLEAMKMELRIQASSDGVVNKVLIRAGQVLERGQKLVEIE